MKEYFMSFEFASIMEFIVYWIPLIICISVYFFRAVKQYRKDLENVESKDLYKPKLTIGLIVLHVLVSITPAVNLIALVFDCARSVFKWCGRFLDIPLVRKKPEK